jgi:homogentisate phytyltransferase/homogentisate geranylgeranyltransferase
MARTVPAPLAASPARALSVLWRFSRPHTLVGTWLSIAGLYVIAATRDVAPGLGDLAATLLAGAAVNIFIVGLNQVEDVEIDRINKPWLPIAAGDLDRGDAKMLVSVCAALAIGLGLTQGAVETAAVATGLAIGAAYSSPPLRLKRFPAVAAASISLVRAVVVNLGVWLHFDPSGPIPGAVLALTLFVVPFSFAIAVLKDVPDAEGDRRHSIATFTVRLGPRPVMVMGMAALTVAYGAMAAFGPGAMPEASAAILVGGHLAVLAILWLWALRVDPADPRGFTRFYMRVWALFFAEYLLVPAAVALG